MLTILGRATSINVRKVLWACDEMDLDHAHDATWGTDKPLHDNTFLRLNPNAQIPVLIDGATTLWESNSIVRYLAAKHKRGDLLPADPAGRADIERWMDWQLGDFNGAWRYAVMALVRQRPDFQNPDEIARSIKAWTAKVAVLDAQLAHTGAYVTGATFTAADIVIGLSVNRWFMTPLDHPEFPAVAAYYDRLSARPAYMRHGRNGEP